MGGGGGDVGVHCIAPYEDVVALKIGVAYRWGRGMFTFIALRHQKMLLRWRSVLHTDGGGGCSRSLHCVTRRCCCVEDRCCIQMGEGDVNVRCIASYEDVGTLKTLLRSRCCYVEDAVTLKMLERWRCCYVDDVGTFKMLLRWRCFYVEDVVTLKMFFFFFFLRWTCCYVEDVTLKMFLRWRCCYVEDVGTLKMLVRWRCCYVEDVVTFKMLWRCYVEEKNGPTCISPMVLWWIMIFLCLFKKPEIPKSTQFLWGKQKWYKLMNLKNKTKHIETPHVELIPDILTL